MDAEGFGVVQFGISWRDTDVKAIHGVPLMIALAKSKKQHAIHEIESRGKWLQAIASDKEQ